MGSDKKGGPMMEKSETRGLWAQAWAMTLLLAFIVALILSSGCAKNKNDKDMVNEVGEVENLNYFDKSLFASGDKYENGKTFSYTKTIMGANEELSAGWFIPGFHYDFGYVKFVITEKELQVHRVGEVNRPNKEKSTLVASYPVTTQFDIGREENDFHEPTNKINKIQRRPWQQRQYINVDFGKNLVKSAELANIFGTEVKESGGQVTTPLKKEGRLLSFNLDLGMTVDNTFGSWEGEYDATSLGSFRGQVKNSFLEVQPSDYEAYLMSNREFQKFGYFRTYENYIDPDQGQTISGRKLFANRFNVCENSAANTGKSCTTNQIVYVLSSNFPQEFLQPTRDVIEAWNKSFQQALNRTDQVVVLKEEEHEIGDTRFNMIAVIDERNPTGLLGVSQTTNNPSTGETLSARSTIYLGAVRLMARDAAQKFDAMKGQLPAGLPKDFSVEDMLITEGQEKVAKNLVQLLKNRQFALRTAKYKQTNPKLSKLNKEGALALKKMLTDELQSTATANRVEAFNNPQISRRLVSSDPAWTQWKTNLTDKQKFDLFKDMNLFDSKLQKQKKTTQAWMEAHGIKTTDFVDPAVEHFIQKFAKQHAGEPDSQVRNELLFEVRRLVYYTTLLHEMGHNFGLRHNFEGSADKDHFHENWNDHQRNRDTLAAKRDALLNSGVPAEDARVVDLNNQITDLALEQESFDYSSIMDYAGGFHESIGGTGKYDDAAIRFGYNKEARENAHDPVLGSQNTPYLFCTDHEVQDKSLLCQRWDKGHNVNTSYKNMIDDYHRDYIWRHFRRDRENFGDPMVHFSRVLMRTMFPLRQATDEFLYQFIMSPQVPATSGQCGQAFMRKSIDAGEVANLCSNDTWIKYQESLPGLDLNDWSNFVVFLLKEDLSGFRVDPSTYIKNGFADLLYTNAIVSDFFQSVIGMGEPGTFLPLEGGPVKVLQALPNVIGNDELKLQVYYMSLGASADEAKRLAAENAKNLVRMRPGKDAKYLMSTLEIDGSFQRIDAIGYEFDKLAATLIMGVRGLPVQKYWNISMNANMYLAPQTKTMTTALYNALITEKEFVAIKEVKNNNGETITAAVPAAWNQLTHIYGIVFAVADLISDQFSEFKPKLRVCAGSEDYCNGGVNEMISFKGAQGGATYKAIQVTSKDSISYEMVKRGADLTGARDQAVVDKGQIPQLTQELKAVRVGDGATNTPEARQKTFINLVKAKDASLARSINPVYGAGTSLTGLLLWQYIMNQGDKLDEANPDEVLYIRDTYLPDALERARALISSRIKDQVVLKQILDAEALVAKDMTDVNGLTARIIGNDRIIQDAADKLQPIEDDIELVRNIFLWLGIR